MHSRHSIQEARVDVEFGAYQAGDARVALAFGIDKNSTAYQAVATASATSATTPPSGSCDNEWQNRSQYFELCLIFVRTILWNVSKSSLI